MAAAGLLLALQLLDVAVHQHDISPVFLGLLVEALKVFAYHRRGPAGDRVEQHNSDVHGRQGEPFGHSSS